MTHPQAAVASPPSGGNRKARRLAKKQARKFNGQTPPTSQAKHATQPQAILDRARELIQLQEYEEAAGLLQKAVAEFPKLAEFWLLLGLSHEGLRSETSAYQCYKQTVELSPGNANGWLSLGRVLHTANRFEASEIALKQCLAIRPDTVEAINYLAWIYFRLGNSKDGLLACERVIALKPEWDEAYYIKGVLHKSAGDLEEARKALLKAHELNPKLVNALHTLADITEGPQSDDLLEKLNAFKPDDISDPKQRSDLLFSTARVHRTQKHCDEAFELYRQANDLVKQFHPFDKDGFRTTIDDLIASFSPDFFKESREGGSNSRRPVFIVGMPRSGTSLTEQIIASHSTVFGAGERDEIKEIANGLSSFKDGDLLYPQDVAKIDPHAWDTLAQQYLSDIERDCPATATRFTDKLVLNFLNLGLITQLFPNASIIHCRRDPMDTCLSCYFMRFDDVKNLSFTYDLEALGFYYRQYDRLMAHWRLALPTPFLDVEYEKLIADQEAESKRIVDFLGLEWEDACLNYYEQEHEVVTASFVQVRKPIYKTAAGRWRRYEKHLGSLQDALGDLA